MNILLTIINIISALSAIVAAFLWFVSALVKIPQSFSVHVVRPNQMPLGGNPIGGQYIGQAYSGDFADLANSLKKQSKFSAWAAMFAGISALIQGILIFI